MVVNEMIRANKVIQLGGPLNVGEFSESGDSDEIESFLTK